MKTVILTLFLVLALAIPASAYHHGYSSYSRSRAHPGAYYPRAYYPRIYYNARPYYPPLIISYWYPTPWGIYIQWIGIPTARVIR
jgi:hypothetical protein